MSQESGLKCLERNVEETIFEGQVKLGFIKGEKINLYYMKDSLLYLLGAEDMEEAELRKKITCFKEFVKKSLGNIKISRTGDRFCICVPAEGVEYTYRSNKENHLLEELIQVLADKNCTLESVLEVFQKKSAEIVCEKIENGEFDYVIYYKNQEIDNFRYCFSFNEMGAYYHRFIPYDYEQIMK